MTSRTQEPQRAVCGADTAQRVPEFALEAASVINYPLTKRVLCAFKVFITTSWRGLC